MIVFCHECDWQSEPAGSVDELAEIVENLGGHLCRQGETSAEDECPECGSNEILVVNED